MLILAIVAIMQDVATPPIETTKPQGAALWKELRVGMSPEMAAEKLRAIDGVKTVVVQRGRKADKPPKLVISYTDGGVTIGSWKITISATFDGEMLREVELSNLSCQSAALEQAKIVGASLRAKYGNGAREHVVDGSGVTIDHRMAFWNDETRVRMSNVIVPPTSDDEVYGEGKVGGALAGFANLMSSAARDADMKACPLDGGNKMQSTVNYSAQSAFLGEQNDSVAKRAANAKATKHGL